MSSGKNYDELYAEAFGAQVAGINAVAAALRMPTYANIVRRGVPWSVLRWMHDGYDCMKLL